jgi:hypothetical protein
MFGSLCCEAGNIIGVGFKLWLRDKGGSIPVVKSIVKYF